MTNISVPIILIDTPNILSGRIFPKSVVEEIERHINQHTAPVRIENSFAGIASNAKIEDNALVVDINLSADTPMGLIVQTLLEHKVKLLYSLGCTGTVTDMVVSDTKDYFVNVDTDYPSPRIIDPSDEL